MAAPASVGATDGSAAAAMLDDPLGCSWFFEVCNFTTPGAGWTPPARAALGVRDGIAEAAPGAELALLDRRLLLGLVKGMGPGTGAKLACGNSEKLKLAASAP